MHMHMHIETMAVALAIIGHAWVSRVEGPAKLRNAVAWVFALLVTLVLIIGLVAR